MWRNNKHEIPEIKDIQETTTTKTTNMIEPDNEQQLLIKLKQPKPIELFKK